MKPPRAAPVLLLAVLICAAAPAREPSFAEFQVVQEPLSRVHPRMHARWMAEQGVSLPGYFEPRAPESTGLRLVGKFGRGPSVEVTGRDSLVFLSLGSEVAIISFADPETPRVLVEVQASGVVAQAVVKDSFLYIGCIGGQAGIEVWNVQNPSAPVLRSRVPTLLSDFCLRDTLLYLTQSLSGPSDSFKVYSVANPENVYLLGSCRDSGDAVTETNNAIFLADRWGLYSLDVTDPRNPHRVGSYSGVPIEVEARGNICCATFMNPNDPDWLRFSILNVSDPASIQPIASLDSAGGYDIYLDDQLAFVSGYYTGGHEFEILDIGDSAHPSRVGTYATPGPNNGVWADGDWTRAYVADGFQGLVVLDLSNLNSPRLDSFMLGADLSEDITVDGQLAYVANEQAGLQILNVADPTRPLAVGNCDTIGFPPFAQCAVGLDSFAYMKWGITLRSVDVHDPGHPTYAGEVATWGWARDLVIRDTLVYAAEGYRFEIFNVARPRQPVLVGSCVAGDATSAGLWLVDTLAFVANDVSQIINVRNPLVPQVVGQFGRGAWNIVVRDTIAFLSTGAVLWYDISDPSSPRMVDSIDLGHTAFGLAVVGNTVYAASFSPNMVYAIDVSDLHTPRVVAQASTPALAKRIEYVPPYLFAACLDAGVCIFETTAVAVEEPEPQAGHRWKPSPTVVRGAGWMNQPEPGIVMDAAGRRVAEVGPGRARPRLAPGIYFLREAQAQAQAQARAVRKIVVLN